MKKNLLKSRKKTGKYNNVYIPNVVKIDHYNALSFESIE